jgi:hypothetical protein
MEGNSSFFFLESNAVLEINEITIKNIHSNSNFSSFIYTDDFNNIVKISKSYLSSLNTPQVMGIFSNEHANITLEDICFENITINNDDTVGGIIYVREGAWLKISSCIFNNIGISKSGCGIGVGNVMNIILISSNFSKCVALSGGGAIYLRNTYNKNVKIKGCIFSNNKAKNGLGVDIFDDSFNYFNYYNDVTIERSFSTSMGILFYLPVMNYYFDCLLVGGCEKKFFFVSQDNSYSLDYYLCGNMKYPCYSIVCVNLYFHFYFFIRTMHSLSPIKKIQQ